MKGRRRSSPKQKQTKEQARQRGFKEAHVLAVVKKGQNERKKKYFHGKPSNLYTLLIHLKRMDSLEKRVRVFAF